MSIELLCLLGIIRAVYSFTVWLVKWTKELSDKALPSLPSPGSLSTPFPLLCSLDVPPSPRHSLELHIFLWFPGDWSTTRSKFSEIAQLHWRSDLKSLQAGRRCATNWTQIKPIVNERGTVGSVTGTRVATNGAIINSGNKAQSI